MRLSNGVVFVTPAKAGVQCQRACPTVIAEGEEGLGGWIGTGLLDSRLRGNDTGKGGGRESENR
jgi:hypothetical protein